MENMNINTSIANYVQKTGADVSDVTESLERVRENLTNGNSVFKVGDNATMEQFCDYMSQFVDDGNCKDCYAEDVHVLFNVLDADGDGVLSNDEMKVIQQSNKGVVNEFGVWNSLYDLDTDKINEEISKNTENCGCGPHMPPHMPPHNGEPQYGEEKQERKSIIGSLFKGAFDSFGIALEGAFNGVKILGDGLVNGFKILGDGLSSSFDKLKNGDLFGAVGDVLKIPFKQLGNGLETVKNLGKNAIDTAKNLHEKAKETVSNVVSGFVGLFKR